MLSGIRKLRAAGEQKLETVHFYHRGQSKRFEVETLLIHEGIVPNTQLTGCWFVSTTGMKDNITGILYEWGNTSMDGVAVAGDGRIAAGALTAEAS